MSIDIDRLRSEIEVDPSGAIAGLKAYDKALDTATRDRSSDVDLDLGSALSDLSAFEAAADLATRDRDMNVDVDRNGALSAAASSLGNISDAATDAGGALADAAGNGGRFGSVLLGAFGSAGQGAGLLTAAVAGTVVGLGPLILAGVAIGSILPGAFAAAAAGAGILMAALAPLVGLLGAIPVALAGLGGVGAAVLGGLAGVVSGVSAYKDATAGAAGATEDLTAKQDALRSAQQGLASAIHQVTMAQRALKDAQEDMKDAPLLAAEALEDAHLRRRQAIISEQRAIQALQAAQQNLTDAQNESARAALSVTQQTDEFTGKVYDVAVQTNDAVDAAQARKDALLDVKQAELDLARAQDETSDSSRELREMEKKGIKNSDIMVDARQRLADAEWNLKQAHQGVANAQRQVARAQKDLAKGSTAGAAATNAWADAQKRLSDEGITFVKFIADDFLPALGDIGKEIQTEMLPPVQRGLTTLMGEFDSMGTWLADIGGMVGETFEDLMTFWTSPGQRPLLVSMFDNLSDSIEAGLGLLRPFSRVMTHIVDAASPMVTRVLEGIGGWMDDIADKWDTQKGKNGLVQFFDDAAYFGELWWDVLEGIWGVLKPIIKAGKPLAAKWLKGMAEDLEDMGDYLSSPKGQRMLKDFFNDAVPALKETWRFVKGIADTLFNSSEGGTDSGFYKFMKSLNDDFVPAFKELFEDLDGADLASDLTAIFSGGVEFINALNDSGTIKALNLLGDTLVAISKGTPWSDAAGATDANNTTAVDENGRPTKKNPDAYEFTKEEKFKEDMEIINEGISNWTKATFAEPIIKQWEDITTAIKEEKAIWEETLGSFKGWASETWGGIKDDAKEKWEGITTALVEEKNIWKDRIEGFKDWMGDLSWGDIWDGLVDAFYTAMEWVADAWNKTLGGLSVNIPGVGKFEIPEINIDGIGSPPSVPGTPGGNPNAPSQPTPGDRGGQTDTGMGAQTDGRRNVQINNTFNEKVDPHHLSRELGWVLAS